MPSLATRPSSHENRSYVDRALKEKTYTNILVRAEILCLTLSWSKGGEKKMCLFHCLDMNEC